MKKKYEPHRSTRYLSVESDNHTKALPELYHERENCCGCSACFAICPANAIEMLPDEEGFLYPAVDAEKCIRCYRCISVCVFKVNQQEKGYLINDNV